MLCAREKVPVQATLLQCPPAWFTAELPEETLNWLHGFSSGGWLTLAVVSR